jgi:hypothetical protein
MADHQGKNLGLVEREVHVHSSYLKNREIFSNKYREHTHIINIPLATIYTHSCRDDV